MCRNPLFHGRPAKPLSSIKKGKPLWKKKALHAESAFCIKGEKFRGTTFVSHFVTAASWTTAVSLTRIRREPLLGIVPDCRFHFEIRCTPDMIQDSGSEATFRACPLKPPSSRWTVLSDRSLRRTPLLPSLFAYRKYFKAKSAKLQGVSGKFMILLLQFSHAADLYMKNVTMRILNSYKSSILYILLWTSRNFKPKPPCPAFGTTINETWASASIDIATATDYTDSNGKDRVFLGL